MHRRARAHTHIHPVPSCTRAARGSGPDAGDALTVVVFLHGGSAGGRCLDSRAPLFAFPPPPLTPKNRAAARRHLGREKEEKGGEKKSRSPGAGRREARRS